MHFHLPKPLHGWREFAGEVGIIVAGVLIALGAEQVVEGFHWRSEMRGARSALHEDARGSLGAALFRQQQQLCVERRLDEIRVVFRDHAAGRPIVLTGPIGRPIYYGGNQGSWAVSIASQAVAHMDLKEKLAFGDAFANYENMQEVQKREQDAWLKLDVLDDPSVLADGDWPMLHQAYAEARSLSARMKLITDFVLADENLGQRPEQIVSVPGIVDAAKRFCAPILPRH